MKYTKQDNSIFEKFVFNVTKATGGKTILISAFLIILFWAVSGPFFGYSETWQLAINAAILLFFLFHKIQNKKALTIQLKLNELVASNEYSSNYLTDNELTADKENSISQKYYNNIVAIAKHEQSIRASYYTIEEHEQTIHKDKITNLLSSIKDMKK